MSFRGGPGNTGWRRLVIGGDPLFSHAGASGELVIAFIRIALVLSFAALPLFEYLRQGPEGTVGVGLLVSLVALVFTLAMLIAVRHNVLGNWTGLVSTVADISLVSGALVVFLLRADPHAAVNSRVIFDVYFIALASTCLRYEAKLCWLSGTLAILQYGGIVLFAATAYDLNSPAYAQFTYGTFSWQTQIYRLVVLLTATGVAAIVVDRSRQLRRLSTIDRLTGVLNRGSFDERLNAELSRARRQGETLVLMMLDVDHFKKFNDDLGHAAGDAALRSVTRAMTGEIRRSDVLARYGGEEFVLIMPSTSAEQGMRKAELIRDRVAKHNIVLPRTDALTARLSISAGVSIFPDDGVTADELVDQADERLFEAKSTGRNRVVGPRAQEPALKLG